MDNNTKQMQEYPIINKSIIGALAIVVLLAIIHIAAGKSADGYALVIMAYIFY